MTRNNRARLFERVERKSLKHPGLGLGERFEVAKEYYELKNTNGSKSSPVSASDLQTGDIVLCYYNDAAPGSSHDNDYNNEFGVIAVHVKSDDLQDLKDLDPNSEGEWTGEYDFNISQLCNEIYGYVHGYVPRSITSLWSNPVEAYINVSILINACTAACWGTGSITIELVSNVHFELMSILTNSQSIGPNCVMEVDPMDCVMDLGPMDVKPLYWKGFSRLHYNRTDHLSILCYIEPEFRSEVQEIVADNEATMHVHDDVNKQFLENFGHLWVPAKNFNSIVKCRWLNPKNVPKPYWQALTSI